MEDYEELRKKYQKLYLGSKLGSKEEKGYYRKLRRYGGLFTAPMRKGLLNAERKAGRDRKNINFWYDVRRTVKTGLIDLQLFIDTAGDKNIRKVLSPQNLKPIVESLLLRPVRTNAEPDLAKAQIAELFIQVGFEYLQLMQSGFIRKYDVETIKNALEEARFLVDLFRPPGERRHISALRLPRN